MTEQSEVKRYGFERFDCAPALRLEAHEQLSRLHIEGLKDSISRLGAGAAVVADGLRSRCGDTCGRLPVDLSPPALMMSLSRSTRQEGPTSHGT